MDAALYGAADCVRAACRREAEGLRQGCDVEKMLGQAGRRGASKEMDEKDGH